MDAFKPGDVVQLRSGGAKMTVFSYYEPPSKHPEAHVIYGDFPAEGWTCVWHVQGTAREAVYPAWVLRLVEAPESDGAGAEPPVRKLRIAKG